MESRDPVIGIDLGTTNSCVGIYKNHRVEIVPTQTGQNVLPSRVWINKEGEKIIGSTACSKQHKVIYNSKRFIGKNYSKISEKDKECCSFRIEKSEAGDIPLMVVEYGEKDEKEKKYKKYTPTQISSFILKELKKLADLKLNKNKNNITPTNAVITVPAYFNEKQREETKKAAELANLKVIQLINEPTAAAFAYCDHLNNLNDKSYTHILVYDFGGGTFDVSLVKVDHENKKIIVLKTDGDNHLGGEDIDQKFVDNYACYYNVKGVEDTPKEIKLKMKPICEAAKKYLTTDTQTNFKFDMFGFDDDGYDISRESFISMIEEILNKTFEIVENMVNSMNGFNKNDINYIVLVGGSSKIPYIEDKLKEMFPASVIKKDINTEEVVAIGATLYASGSVLNGYECVDIISHSLSTDVAGGKSQILFPKNSVIPSTKILTYINTDDSGFSHIGIYEGENKDYSDNKYLGGCNIPITSAKPGMVKFTVIYKINKSGVIEITAKEENPNPHEILEKIELNESV